MAVRSVSWTNLCRLLTISAFFACLGFYGFIEWFFTTPPEDNLALFEARNFPSSFSEESRLAYTKAEELKRRYTVRVNTFRRNDLLKKVVQHYVTCPNIDRVQVVWSDLQNDPPVASFYSIPGLEIESSNSKKQVENERERDEVSSSKKKRRPWIQYEMHDVDSLNNRFIPILPILTEAVLSVDDDLALPCELLDFAHSVWRQSPRTMVGFMPRMHGHEGGHFTYLNWWHVWRHGVYSMVLTKACFLHQDYLHYYAGTKVPDYDQLSNSMPPPIIQRKAEEEVTLAAVRQRRSKHGNLMNNMEAAPLLTTSDQQQTGREAMSAVRAYIDAHMNCEDIAMSFLVANLTQLPAVWVRGEGIAEIGHSLLQSDKGISSDQAHHYAARSSCVDTFVSLFGKMPLIAATSKVDRASNSWLWR